MDTRVVLAVGRRGAGERIGFPQPRTVAPSLRRSQDETSIAGTAFDASRVDRANRRLRPVAGIGAQHEDKLLADVPTSHATCPSPSQDEAYRALHDQRVALERNLALTQHEQRFATDDRAVEAARDRESTLLVELDRVLTLIRAAEVRRRNGSASRRWQ